MIYSKQFFHETINNDVKTYENIKTITTVQGDDYNWLFVRLSLLQKK